MSIEAVKKLAESWLAEAESLDENAGITQQWSGVPLTPEVIANRKAVARQLAEQANAVLEVLGEPDPADVKPDLESIANSAAEYANTCDVVTNGYEVRVLGDVVLQSMNDPTSLDHDAYISYAIAIGHAAGQLAMAKQLAPGHVQTRERLDGYDLFMRIRKPLHELGFTVTKPGSVHWERVKKSLNIAIDDLTDSDFTQPTMPEPSASPDHEFVFGDVQSMRIRVWNETSRAVCIVDFDGIANPAGYISAFVAGLSPLGDHQEARRAEKPKHEPDPAGSVKRYLGGKWD